jgi:hypothetical protein
MTIKYTIHHSDHVPYPDLPPNLRVSSLLLAYADSHQLELQEQQREQQRLHKLRTSEYRFCSRCQQDKLKSQFGLRSSGRLQSYCKKCDAERRSLLRKEVKC